MIIVYKADWAAFLVLMVRRRHSMLKSNGEGGMAQNELDNLND